MQPVRQDDEEEFDDEYDHHREPSVSQVMLPSIKESDRYTTEDRVELAMKGVLITIFAIAANIFFWVLGWIVFYLVFLVLVGPVLICQAMCSEFKGNIELVRTPRNETCPSCGSEPQQRQPNRPSVEWYKEKSGQQRGRQVEWIPKIHCRWCGYKADRGAMPEARVPVVAATAVRSTRTPAANAALPQNLPDDPIAKAQAILRSSKAKQQTSQDGKADYTTVPVVEAKIVASSEDASTSTSATSSSTVQQDAVVEMTRAQNIV